MLNITGSTHNKSGGVCKFQGRKIRSISIFLLILRPESATLAKSGDDSLNKFP